ncbi:hypothetical protein M5K25_019008 [Dendrobium thyrsiflorum]|uniref:Uncharacterized protein n=1 Tax=Dendrobium thyrsiflorum TaxID=117978 RepID=A0ABD0UKL7_DENTH
MSKLLDPMLSRNIYGGSMVRADHVKNGAQSSVLNGLIRVMPDFEPSSASGVAEKRSRKLINLTRLPCKTYAAPPGTTWQEKKNETKSNCYAASKDLGGGDRNPTHHCVSLSKMFAFSSVTSVVAFISLISDSNWLAFASSISSFSSLFICDMPGSSVSMLRRRAFNSKTSAFVFCKVDSSSNSLSPASTFTCSAISNADWIFIVPQQLQAQPSIVPIQIVMQQTQLQMETSLFLFHHLPQKTGVLSPFPQTQELQSHLNAVPGGLQAQIAMPYHAPEKFGEAVEYDHPQQQKTPQACILSPQASLPWL